MSRRVSFAGGGGGGSGGGEEEDALLPIDRSRRRRTADDENKLRPYGIAYTVPTVMREEGNTVL